jgi:hypothetical protein
MNIIPDGGGATAGVVLDCGSAAAAGVSAGWSPVTANMGNANITKINAKPETTASFPNPLRRQRNIGDIAITFSFL